MIDGEEPGVSGSMLRALQCGTGERKMRNEGWQFGLALGFAISKEMILILTNTQEKKHMRI